MTDAEALNALADRIEAGERCPGINDPSMTVAIEVLRNRGAYPLGRHIEFIMLAWCYGDRNAAGELQGVLLPGWSLYINEMDECFTIKLHHFRPNWATPPPAEGRAKKEAHARLAATMRGVAMGLKGGDHDR